MELLSLLGVAFLLLILYWIYSFAYAPFQVFKGTGIKGPTPLPFYGNYRERARLGIVKYYDQLVKEYGSVVGLFNGQNPNILVTDLDIIKQVAVKEFDSFPDRPPFPDLLRRKKGSPRGLFTIRGETWRNARKTLSPSFSSAKMKMMVPLVKRSTDTLVKLFEERVESKKSFDVFNTFGSFTMETILAIAFGRVIDLQRGESDQLTEASKAIFRGAQEGSSQAIATVTMILSNFPWMETLFRYRVSISKRGQHFLVLHHTAHSIVKARRESNTPPKYKDLLQLMIDATGEEEDGGEDSKDTQKRKLTDNEIVSHSVTFLLAGYETTANTLAYTSYLLALNPEIQEKLQREIDDYFEEKSDCSLYDAVQEIEYLDMVLQESLRIYPPVALISRHVDRTTTLNGITFPKGASVTVPVYLIHKDPRYWEEPEKFDPNRFTAEEKAKRPQLAHMPFWFGPRNCIGMRFALLEAKMALIELLKKYTFVRAPDTEVPLETVVGLTLAPKHGIFLKVQSRDF